MYPQDRIDIALRVYHQCKSVTKTIRVLGYPTRRALYTWIENEGTIKSQRKTSNTINTAMHPRNPPFEVKMDAIHRCFELGEGIKSVSEDIGYTRASIYSWRKRYLKRGAVTLMNGKSIKPSTLIEGTVGSAPEIEHLQAQMKDMQLEIDILKETIDVLKNKYSLPLLLKQLSFPKSSYDYQESVNQRWNKYMKIRKRISEIFYESKGCYGYRRIHGLLKREEITVSEKVVRRIMQEDNLIVKVKKRKKYNSYQGEISPSVPNVIQRNFHADKPNEKWLTNITEFAIPAGKVYLSTLVDCYDGMLPCWMISTTSDSVLVNRMLDQAISKLHEDEHPVIHSDRSCQYRWSGWIERMEKAGLERSMSKKSCSPDNSACEGLFGRLKNEMFYTKDWGGVSIPKFIDLLNNYLVWYNEKRIKISLGNMSPREYRQSLGLAV